MDELAEERTNWAHERTRLAKERTYAAWVRTGMAAVGFGLAIEKFLPSVGPGWMLDGVGISFVFAGILVFGMGFKTYLRVRKQLAREGYKGIPITLMGFLTLICLLGSILAMILIVSD